MAVQKIGGWVIDAMADHSGEDLTDLTDLRDIEAIVSPMKGENLARKVKIFKELQEVVAKVGGKGLTKSWMKANGKANLYCYTIRLLGSCESLAKILGVLDDFQAAQDSNQKKKPTPRVWTQETFDRTVEEIIAKFDSIPTVNVLNDNGYTAFVGIMHTRKWCGTLDDLRTKHGVQAEKVEKPVKPARLTKEELTQKYFNEIRELVNDHGVIALTKSWMEKRGHVSLYQMMWVHLGGAEAMAERLMILPDLIAMKSHIMKTKKPSREVKWTKAYFDEKAREIIKKYGRIPEGDILKKEGYVVFVQSITKFYNSSVEMRESFGVSAKQLNLKAIKKLVDAQGPIVISRSWLDKNGHPDCAASIRRDWNGDCKAIATELGVLEEYMDMLRHKAECSNPTKWTDEFFDIKVKEVIQKFGGIPCANALTSAGYGDLLSHINQSNKFSGMGDLRKKYDVANGHLVAANGTLLKSHAEVCFANFLIERGVTFKVGERYPKEYETMSGKKRGFYDFHIQVTSQGILNVGDWLDIEIWGGPGLHGNVAGYDRTRKLKEKFNNGRPSFLGIEFSKCYAPGTIATLMKPFIGEPDVQSSEAQPVSSDTERLLRKARSIAAHFDGKFPSSKWLSRTGAHAGRAVLDWEDVSWSPFEWDVRKIGGYGKLRELLSAQN